MSFIRKLFRGSKQTQSQPPTKKKQKPSFLTWLCTSKPSNLQQPQPTHLQSLNAPIRKSFISTTSNLHPQSKLLQRLSFAQDRGEFPQDQLLRGQLVDIFETTIQKIEDLLGDNGLYGMVNSDQPLTSQLQEEIGIWLKIGKTQQINSLSHIKPYYFDKIFVFCDQLGTGPDYTIQDILNCKQNIYLKLYNKNSVQTIIDLYEKDFKRLFAFKLMVDCFNKLKITVYKTRRNDTWLVFNQQTDPGLYVDEFLVQLGFDHQHQQYAKLKEEIPTGLTLQQYIDIIEHKEKLQSKYEGQNVAEYIKTKFLEKISRNGITPRNDSPRTAQKQKSSDSSKSEQCHRYVLSMTANTLPKQRLQEMYASNQLAPRGENKNEKNSFEEEIFEFNVYKDEKEQEAKRVAISKQRKKRSRSQDITVNDLHNVELDDNDFFDKID